MRKIRAAGPLDEGVFDDKATEGEDTDTWDSRDSCGVGMGMFLREEEARGAELGSQEVEKSENGGVKSEFLEDVEGLAQSC